MIFISATCSLTFLLVGFTSGVLLLRNARKLRSSLLVQNHVKVKAPPQMEFKYSAVLSRVFPAYGVWNYTSKQYQLPRIAHVYLYVSFLVLLWTGISLFTSELALAITLVIAFLACLVSLGVTIGLEATFVRSVNNQEFLKTSSIATENASWVKDFESRGEGFEVAIVFSMMLIALTSFLCIWETTDELTLYNFLIGVIYDVFFRLIAAGIVRKLKIVTVYENKYVPYGRYAEDKGEIQMFDDTDFNISHAQLYPSSGNNRLELSPIQELSSVSSPPIDDDIVIHLHNQESLEEFIDSFRGFSLLSQAMNHANESYSTPVCNFSPFKSDLNENSDFFGFEVCEEGLGLNIFNTIQSHDNENLSESAYEEIHKNDSQIVLNELIELTCDLICKVICEQICEENHENVDYGVGQNLWSEIYMNFCENSIPGGEEKYSFSHESELLSENLQKMGNLFNNINFEESYWIHSHLEYDSDQAKCHENDSDELSHHKNDSDEASHHKNDSDEASHQNIIDAAPEKIPQNTDIVQEMDRSLNIKDLDEKLLNDKSDEKYPKMNISNDISYILKSSIEQSIFFNENISEGVTATVSKKIDEIMTGTNDKNEPFTKENPEMKNDPKLPSKKLSKSKLFKKRNDHKNRKSQDENENMHFHNPIVPSPSLPIDSALSNHLLHAKKPPKELSILKEQSLNIENYPPKTGKTEKKAIDAFQHFFAQRASTRAASCPRQTKSPQENRLDTSRKKQRQSKPYGPYNPDIVPEMNAQNFMVEQIKLDDKDFVKNQKKKISAINKTYKKNFC